MGKLRILLPLGALLAFLGYAGPWVDHPVAGLAILGLTSKRIRQIPSPGAGGNDKPLAQAFYLPLVAISLALSLCTWRSLNCAGASRSSPGC